MKKKLFTYFYNVFVIQCDNRLEYEFVAYETISHSSKREEKLSLAAFIYSESTVNRRRQFEPSFVRIDWNANRINEHRLYFVFI